MNSPGLDDEARERILHRDILPLYFAEAEPDPAPTLVLVTGQPGAGRSRASSTLAREEGSGITVLAGEDLRAFHPATPSSSLSADPESAASLAQSVAGWVSACIRHARENRRSVVLEGAFANVAAAAGTAERFAAEGFATRVVAVGARRAESLLAVTSEYLRKMQAGRAPSVISRDAHDEGFAATRALVASVEDSAWVDRLTVVDRTGRVVLDADNPAAFAGAGAALAAAQSARMGRFDATQWLSELHHVTDFAATRRQLPAEVTELLVDLHETSLREVIPELHVPAGGPFATAMEQKTVAALVALRKNLAPRVGPVDIAAPVVVPVGPERGGVSR
ncbi:zeta toxin family protein [Microbacterium sp. LMI12-1-1.1]|uniref:zeta toxin family protein n=1 Tax=Microbacterium sp. LMI12-1-1.1 TaxID=3135225 RepID=UPI00343523D1